MGTRGTKRIRLFSQGGSSEMLLTSVEGLLNFAETNRLYNGVQLDIRKLVSSMNIEIKDTILDPSISGSLSRDGDNWVIQINKSHHTNRQRFTLGHELAHYVLHKSDSDNFTDTILFRGLSNDNIERAANDFASRLLMPEDKVKHLINNEQVRSIDELANRFGVSAAAMLYRVKQLGYKTKE